MATPTFRDSATPTIKVGRDIAHIRLDLCRRYYADAYDIVLYA